VDRSHLWGNLGVGFFLGSRLRLGVDSDFLCASHVVFGTAEAVALLRALCACCVVGNLWGNLVILGGVERVFS
jgi:hypothetical protein